MQLADAGSSPSAILRALTEGTAATMGEAFFRALARHAAQALHARYAFVAERLNADESRSLAYWEGANFGEGFSYRYAGTPCKRVSEGHTCSTGTGLRELYPEDRWLVDIGADSYVGVPMKNDEGRVIGHVAVLHTEPMQVSEADVTVLQFFAARASVELERMRAFDELRQQAKESEERFRDLFDEAPIAYVNEELDSHFIRANRTAMKILGITPEEVPTTYGKNFVSDALDAQRRMRAAFESIGRGTDTGGVVLEMRRKDGTPFWIEWWSRPDPSGRYTRTMFLDITERVLMGKEKARLEAQNIYLQEEIRTEHNFEEMVGSAPALIGLLKKIDSVAASDAAVLIQGETGTGKELVARALHNRGSRRDRPLVKVNCGAISAGLVESELFGHVKGAFTGALARRVGRFELADGGTIFLDEVGELPADTQVKLLRVLQEQEFEPVGSSQPVRVNVRVIAATNRDLAEAVKSGRFRADLFYRLNVIPLRVPPLRERREDIPQLAMYFLERSARKAGKDVRGIASETLARLKDYDWPGNVRELQNLVERGVVMASGPALEIDPAQFAAAQLETAAPVMKSATAADSPDGALELEEMERRHIRAVLEKTRWVIEGAQGAAKILGLNPSTIRSRMKKLGINRSA